MSKSIKKTSLIVNSISNIIAKVWSLASIYLFVPLYINILGQDAYGLVSFFVTMQTVLNLLGLGLSSTLRREFASESADVLNIATYRYQLVRSTETVYAAIAVIIVLACISSGTFLASEWFSASSLDQTLINEAIELMGVSIALQLVSNLYQGCLLGFEAQVLANSVMVSWSLVKQVGSVFVITALAPDVRVFYLWHVFVDVVYLVTLRILVMSLLNSGKCQKWSFAQMRVLRSVWRYAAGLIVISAISVVNKQFDKIVVSGFFSLQELGAYNSSFTLGSVVTMVSSALSISYFSYFTRKVTSGVGNEGALFLRCNKSVCIGIAALGSFLAVFGSDLLLFWTGAAEYVQIMQAGVSFIILGSMFLAFQELPYAFALSHGDTSLNVKFGLLFLPCVIVIQYVLIASLGIMGGCIASCLVNFMMTVVYLFLIHGKYLSSYSRKWMLLDILLPVLMSLVVAATLKQVLLLASFSNPAVVLLALIGGIIHTIVLFMIFDRNFLHSLLRKK